MKNLLVTIMFSFVLIKLVILNKKSFHKIWNNLENFKEDF